MRKIIVLILTLAVISLSFSNYIYSYIGSRRGLNLGLDVSVDFTGIPNPTFLGFGYYIDGGIGYSSFLGDIAYSVYAGVYKDGGSLFRMDNGNLVEYVFEDDRYEFLGRFGMGFGEKILIGVNSTILYGNDIYYEIMPAVGLRSQNAVTVVFGGIDSTLRYYLGVGYINEWFDMNLYSSFKNDANIAFVFSSSYFDFSTSYNITTGDLFADAYLKLFGAKIGGKVSITDSLDYSIIGGFSLSFGSTYPESWYINNVIKYYAKRDYENAIKLAEEGLKYYPISEKLKKYHSLAKRDYFLKQVMDAYSVGDYFKVRKIMSECLKEYPDDILVLRRAVFISEKTVLNKNSYVNVGLHEDQINDFIEAIMSMYGEDYDSAVSILSGLYLKTNNEYIALKLSEAFVLQGAWKNAEKMLQKVQNKFPEYYFVKGMIEYFKNGSGEDSFKKDITYGDIDHIRESLFMLLKIYINKGKYSDAVRYGSVLEALGWGRYKIEAMYYMADAYLNVGDEEKAADYFSNLVGIYEDELSDLEKRQYKDLYKKALNMLVGIYEKLAKRNKNYYLSAAVYLEKMIQIETDEKRRQKLIKRRAIFLYKGGDYASAVFELENIVKYDESLLSYYYSALARKDFEDIQNKISSLSYPLSMIKDDLKKVEQDYRNLLKINEDFMEKEDWMNLAYVSVALKDEDMYKKASKKLKAISEEEYHLLNAYMEFSIGRYSNASLELKNVNARNLEGVFAALYFKLKGRLAYEAKDYDRAILYLERFMDEYKGVGMEAADLIALSKAYMKKGNMEKALKVVSEENVGISPMLYLIRAEALVGLKKYEEAYRTLNELLSTCDESSVDKEILIQAYTMLGDISFKIMNFPAALKYYKYAYDTFGKREKTFLEKIEVSELIVKILKGSEVDKSEFSKFMNSEDLLVRVVSTVEVADQYLDQGLISKAEEMLNSIQVMNYELDIFKALVQYEYAKLYVYKGAFYNAAKCFKDVWETVRDEKILKKYLVTALISGKYEIVDYDEIKEFYDNPVVGNIVGYINLIKNKNYKKFVEKHNFMRQIVFLGVTGKLTDEIEYRRLVFEYLSKLDPYNRAFFNEVFKYLKLSYLVRNEKLRDDSEPVYEIFRAKYVGTIKSIDLPDFYVPKDYKIRWKYGVRVNRYEVIEACGNSEKILQRSRRNYIKGKFEEGFHIFYIRAYRVIENVIISDKTPTFAIKIRESLPPQFVSISPKNSEVFVKVKFSWKLQRENMVEKVTLYYLDPSLSMRRREVDNKGTAVMNLSPGNYLWFVAIRDVYGDYVFSPVESIVVSLKIVPKELWKVNKAGSIYAAASDNYIYTLNYYNGVLSKINLYKGREEENFKLSHSGKLHLGRNIAVIIDRVNSYLYVYDIKAGKLKFGYEKRVASNVALDKSDNLYLSAGGRIYAITSSGKTIWTYPKELFTKIEVSKVVATQKYIIALVLTNGTWVIVLDKNTGQAIGGYQISDEIRSESDLIVTSRGYIAVILSDRIVVSNMKGENIRYIAIDKKPYSGEYRMVESDNGVVVALTNYYKGKVYSVDLARGFVKFQREFKTIKDISTGGNGETYAVLEDTLCVLDSSGRTIGEVKGLSYSYEREFFDFENGILILKNDSAVVAYKIPEFTQTGLWNQRGSNPQRSFYIETRGR